MSLYNKFLKPAFFSLDAEHAHQLTIKALKSGLVPSPPRHRDPRLSQKLLGLEFANPVGLAAGFDKNAEVFVQALRLGFGFVEVGTITPQPQDGNPTPRIFRLVKDEAIINRLGFNNQGHNFALKQLTSVPNRTGPVGVNIGANKNSEDFVTDYELGLRCFWSTADYFTANISSPNTPGLRNLQSKDTLTEMLNRIHETKIEMQETSGVSKPILLKIAPDLSEAEIEDVTNVINRSSLDGVIVSNTTIDRPASLRSSNIGEAGGLSGKPLFTKSTIVLAKARKRIDPKIPIIGVGGVHDVETAFQKILAGANLVQLYSGMIFKGPHLARDIAKGLSQKMATLGVDRIGDIIGQETESWSNQRV